MTRFALPLLLAWLLGAAACERPIVVKADPTGSTRLTLAGDLEKTGVLTKALRVGEEVIPEGTQVMVYETWLLRRDEGATPPGYRLIGHYDPEQRSDGLVLPRNSIDVYYLSAILPERDKRVPVPKAALKLDAR